MATVIPRTSRINRKSDRPHWKRVAIVLNMEYAYARGIARGVYSYAHPDKMWKIRLVPIRGLYPQQRLDAWKPDGIIGHVPWKKPAQTLYRLGAHFVNCTDERWWGEPTVTVDNDRVSALAGEYFRKKPMASYGFVGSEKAFSQARYQGYCKYLERYGMTVSSFFEAVPGMYESVDPKKQSKLEKDLAAWLFRLEKPAGILFQNDFSAVRVMELCREIGINIPAEIQAIGVDNDETLCHMAQPALTSIKLPVNRIGYEAAMLLDKLLSGRSIREENIRLPPIALVERESTGTYRTQDPIMHRALQFIQDNASGTISVSAIAKRAGMSRRALERRFVQEIGRTPRQEIEMIRIHRASDLLINGELSIAEIAEKCGFGTHARFTITFSKHYGMSPRAWRSRNH